MLDDESIKCCYVSQLNRALRNLSVLVHNYVFKLGLPVQTITEVKIAYIGIILTVLVQYKIVINLRLLEYISGLSFFYYINKNVFLHCSGKV